MGAIQLPLGITNIPETFAQNQTVHQENQFGYQGIWIFSGAQGTGKTLMAMSIAREMLKEYPDALICSNISIYGVPSIPYTGLESFEKYNNGAKGIIFLIDEIHTLYSSLESVKMSISSLTVWSQNRKNRRVILGTSQRYNRVAKGIREQSTYVYQCKRPFLGLFYPYYIFDGADFNDDGKYVGENKVPLNFYVPSVGAMRMYNTLEVVIRDDFDKETKGKQK